MQPQAAIWVFCRMGRGSKCTVLLHSCKAARTLSHLCSVGEEVASFLSHVQTKEEMGCVFFADYCCLCFCPTGWMAITADFLSSIEPGPAEAALTLRYPEGREGSCQNSHLSLLPWGSAPPAAASRGPGCTLLLIRSISSLEGTGPEWMWALFSPLLPSAPLKSCVSVSLWLERVCYDRILREGDKSAFRATFKRGNSRLLKSTQSVIVFTPMS